MKTLPIPAAFTQPASGPVAHHPPLTLRFASKLDELRPQFKEDPPQFKHLCDQVVVSNGGQSLKVVDFLVHLLEHGSATVSALTAGLPSVNTSLLSNNLQILGAYGYVVTSTSGKIGMSQEGEQVLEKGYPDLTFPKNKHIYNRSVRCGSFFLDLVAPKAC